jgi:hypothetical protein
MSKIKFYEKSKFWDNAKLALMTVCIYAGMFQVLKMDDGVGGKAAEKSNSIITIADNEYAVGELFYVKNPENEEEYVCIRESLGYYSSSGTISIMPDGYYVHAYIDVKTGNIVTTNNPNFNFRRDSIEKYTEEELKKIRAMIGESNFIIEKLIKHIDDEKLGKGRILTEDDLNFSDMALVK